MTVSIRPEKSASSAPIPRNRPRRIASRRSWSRTTFLGEASEHVLEIGEHRLRAGSSPPLLNLRGEVALEIDPGDCLVLPE